MASSRLQFFIYIFKQSNTCRVNFLKILPPLVVAKLIDFDVQQQLTYLYKENNDNGESIEKLLEILKDKNIQNYKIFKDCDISHWTGFIDSVKVLKKKVNLNYYKNSSKLYSMKLIDSSDEDMKELNMQNFTNILKKDFGKIIIHDESGWGKQCEYFTALWVESDSTDLDNFVLLNLRDKDFELAGDIYDILLKTNFHGVDMEKCFLKFLLKKLKKNNLILFIDCGDYCDEKNQIFKSVISESKLFIKSVIWSSNKKLNNFGYDSLYKLKRNKHLFLFRHLSESSNLKNLLSKNREFKSTDEIYDKKLKHKQKIIFEVYDNEEKSKIFLNSLNFEIKSSTDRTVENFQNYIIKNCIESKNLKLLNINLNISESTFINSQIKYIFYSNEMIKTHCQLINLLNKKIDDEEIICHLEKSEEIKAIIFLIGSNVLEKKLCEKLKENKLSIILLTFINNQEFCDENILIYEKSKENIDNIKNYLNNLKINFNKELFDGFFEIIKNSNYYFIYSLFKYVKMKDKNKNSIKKCHFESSKTSEKNILTIRKSLLHSLLNFFFDENLNARSTLKVDLFHFNELFVSLKNFGYELKNLDENLLILFFSEALKNPSHQYNNDFFKEIKDHREDYNIKDKYTINHFIQNPSPNKNTSSILNNVSLYNKLIEVHLYITDNNFCVTDLFKELKILKTLNINLEKNVLQIFIDFFGKFQKFYEFLEKTNITHLMVNCNLIEIEKFYNDTENKYELIDNYESNKMEIKVYFNESPANGITEYKDWSKRIFKRLSEDFLNFLDLNKNSNIKIDLKNKFLLHKDYRNVLHTFSNWKSDLKISVTIKNLNQYKLWDTIAYVDRENRKNCRKNLKLNIENDELIISNFENILKDNSEDDNLNWKDIEEEIYYKILTKVSTINSIILTKFYYIDATYFCILLKRLTNNTSIEKITINERYVGDINSSGISNSDSVFILETISNFSLQCLSIDYKNDKIFFNCLKKLSSLRKLEIIFNCEFNKMFKEYFDISNLESIKMRNLSILQNELIELMKKADSSKKSLEIDCKIVKKHKNWFFSKYRKITHSDHDKTIFKKENYEFQKKLFEFCNPKNSMRNKVKISGKNIFEIYLKKFLTLSEDYRDFVIDDLRLMSTELTDLYLTKLPESIKNEEFKSNCLKIISKDNIEIVRVHFEQNKILSYEKFKSIWSTVADIFGNSIEMINVSDSIDSNEKLNHFLDEFKQFSKCVKIDLSSSIIAGENLIEFYKKIEDLKKINLKYFLNDNLNFYQSLKCLKLIDCTFDDSDLPYIFKIIDSNIESLFIGENESLHLTEKNLDMIKENLLELDISNVYFDKEISQLEYLKKLKIKSNDMDRDQCRMLEENFSKNGKSLLTLIDCNELEIDQKNSIIDMFAHKELYNIS